uniref:Uncharacterized protein n=1 Tax=Panagrolaimus sp. JU765 TaxID=591449 RepID=A0AC34RTF7_9BILA
MEFVILASHYSKIDLQDVIISTYSDKSVKLHNWKTFMKVVGDPADSYFYAKFIQNEIFKSEKDKIKFTPSESHDFVKQKINFVLENGDYWQCDTLIGGYDEVSNKTWLSFLDYRGYAITDKPVIVRNFPGLDAENYLNSIYHPRMSFQSAIDAIHTCLKKVSETCGYQLPMFSLLVIDKDGARQHEEYL